MSGRLKYASPCEMSPKILLRLHDFTQFSLQLIGLLLLINKLHWQPHQDINPIPFSSKLMLNTSTHFLWDISQVQLIHNYNITWKHSQTLGKTLPLHFNVNWVPCLLFSTSYLLCSAQVCSDNTMQKLHIPKSEHQSPDFSHCYLSVITTDIRA